MYSFQNFNNMIRSATFIGLVVFAYTETRIQNQTFRSIIRSIVLTNSILGWYIVNYEGSRTIDKWVNHTSTTPGIVRLADAVMHILPGMYIVYHMNIRKKDLFTLMHICILSVYHFVYMNISNPEIIYAPVELSNEKLLKLWYSTYAFVISCIFVFSNS